MEQPLKTPRRPLAAALLAACALYPAPRALQAAHPIQTPPPPVPLRWTVETSRAQVAQFEAYRGETLLLEAEMRSYGKPFSEVLQPDLYWQTNGMGNAWWKAPATFEGNVCRAFWSPTNDCGGTVYNCFIGGPDATYRAAFRLRMLPSPGYTPNHLKLPTVTYDAALVGEPTVNGTNLVDLVRRMNESETMTARETNTELRIFHGDAFSSMRVEPPKSIHTLPLNQWRALELGDEKTVAKTRYHETDKLLVGSPRDLYFIDRVEIDGATTNYVLKSFQSYLDALSPDAVGDLIGNYLPTNGGGTVTGEVKVLGNLFVSGAVSMPNLVDVRTANIIANGFVVSNRVVVAESGLMVSNGVCHINGAIANGTIQATRVHIMDGGDVTFGGSPENPTAGMRGMIEGLTLAKITELGFTVPETTVIAPTDGMYTEGTGDRLARLVDLVAHASPNCVRPIGDQTTSGGSRASITLRNWCLNVPTESLPATKELRVFYPLHEIKDHFDMTQRLSFGIYFPMAPAATVSVKWDYAPDDGGFELRGETGEELDSISAGDYIWFQQIGPNVLSVTKRNVSNTIHPLVND